MGVVWSVVADRSDRLLNEVAECDGSPKFLALSWARTLGSVTGKGVENTTEGLVGHASNPIPNGDRDSVAIVSRLTQNEYTIAGRVESRPNPNIVHFEVRLQCRSR